MSIYSKYLNDKPEEGKPKPKPNGGMTPAQVGQQAIGGVKSYLETNPITEVGEERQHANMYRTMENEEDDYYNQLKYGDARERKDGSVTNYNNDAYIDSAKKNNMYGAYSNYRNSGGTSDGFDRAARKSNIQRPRGGGDMRQVRERDNAAYGGMLNFRNHAGVLPAVGRGDEGTRSNLFNSFFPGTYGENQEQSRPSRSYRKRYEQRRGDEGDLVGAYKVGGILYKK